MRQRLDAQFFMQPTNVVAQSLLGCHLFRRTNGHILSATISETEAHVYFVYGLHYMFNIVTSSIRES